MREIDAVDISKDALEVAARNVADYGLEDRIALQQGDLFEPLGGDAIRSDHHQSALCRCAKAWRACRANAVHEPRMAFDGGADGLDIVRRIIDEARAASDAATAGCCARSAAAASCSKRPIRTLPLLWLDTEESEGEVFWIEADALYRRPIA